MKAGKIAAWAVCLGVVCVLTVGGCCGPVGSGCSLGTCGRESRPARSEAAVAQKDNGEAPPAKTITDWMSLQRSDLP